MLRAIVDLVDNSVDGARRMRGADRNFAGLEVRISVSGESFEISDNCGGMDIEIAKNYAFRFGRSSERASEIRSVGQFGVGMKRALFKLGNFFKVESVAKNSRFLVEQDVVEWSKDDTNWTFKFKELEEDRTNPEPVTGTTITVTRLHDSVASALRLDRFPHDLRAELTSAQQESVDAGLHLSVNGVLITSDPLKLLQSSDIIPAFRSLEIMEDPTIYVRLYAGLATESETRAGWNVSCNGRLVLEADQTAVTGWGEGASSLHLPKYHPQFARFRGAVLFECDDASKLPWNTTKTGIDQDSPVYQYVRNQMIDVARPVFTYINRVKAMPKELRDTVERKLDGYRAVPLRELTRQDSFKATVARGPRIPARELQISYKRERTMVERVMSVMKVDSPQAVGERTFDYYVEAELD